MKSCWYPKRCQNCLKMMWLDFGPQTGPRWKPKSVVGWMIPQKSSNMRPARRIPSSEKSQEVAHLKLSDRCWCFLALGRPSTSSHTSCRLDWNLDVVVVRSQYSRMRNCEFFCMKRGSTRVSPLRSDRARGRIQELLSKMCQESAFQKSISNVTWLVFQHILTVGLSRRHQEMGTKNKSYSLTVCTCFFWNMFLALFFLQEEPQATVYLADPKLKSQKSAVRCGSWRLPFFWSSFDCVNFWV